MMGPRDVEVRMGSVLSSEADSPQVTRSYTRQQAGVAFCEAEVTFPASERRHLSSVPVYNCLLNELPMVAE